MTFAVYPLRRAIVRQRCAIPARQFHYSVVWAAHKALQPFKLADIGEGITECEVIKWSVKPLSAVQMFDPLCEVQSDKASVEITSPYEGVVKELLVKEGDVAKVGENLCIIEVESESDDGNGVETALAQAQEKAAEPEQQVLAPTPPPAHSLHPLDPRSRVQAPVQSSGATATEPVEVLALPSVRHFAKQVGIDLSVLSPGSGKGGRVERRDVEDYLARTSARQELSTTERAETQKVAEGEVVVELGRTRYAMWRAMERSLEIPHFGYSTYLDITNLHNLLPILSQHIPPYYLATPPGENFLPVNAAAVHPPPPPPDIPSTGKYARLTYLPFLLKTLSRAMLEWPLFRSSITPRISEAGAPQPPPPPSSSSSFSSPTTTALAKPTLTIRPHADISVALSTPTGLYTPTLQRVDTQSIYALASRLAHVAALGRRVPSALGLAEMPRAGGTLTVSNVGAVGKGEFAHPVLVPGGGVAIVAVGRARWVSGGGNELEGEVVVGGRGGKGKRLRVGVSWSADHRVVEGAELAAFVECWRGYVEHPERLIADSI